MRLIFPFLALAIFLSPLATPAWAAKAAKSSQPQQTQQNLKAGDKVQTKYFSLILPPGWEMPQPPHEMPDGISILFAKRKSDLAVTINVLNTALTAKELATRTVANMRKSGLRPTEPREFNGLWRVGIKGKVEGEAWFASNGRLNSATVLLGPNLKQVNELLKAIKPVEPGLFPTHI